MRLVAAACRSRPLLTGHGPVDRPGERDQGQAPWPLRRQRRGRLGQRDRRDVPPHHRRRQDLAGRLGPRCLGPRLPGRPRRRRRDRLPAVDRRRATSPASTRPTDGGATWATLYVNKDPKGFLDALAFWDADHGLALGDQVDGRFVILTTDDGGKTWGPIPPEGMPPALPGEGAFAASGTCLVVGKGWARLVRHGRGEGVPCLPLHGPGEDLDGPRDAGHGGHAVGGHLLPGVPRCRPRDRRRGRLQGAGEIGERRRPHLGRGPDLEAAEGPGAGRLPIRRGVCPGHAGTHPGGRRPHGVGRLGGRGRELAAVGDDGVPCGRVRKPAAGWAVGDDGLVAKFDGAGDEPGIGKARGDRP